MRNVGDDVPYDAVLFNMYEPYDIVQKPTALPGASPRPTVLRRNHIAAARQSNCPRAGRPVAVPYKQACFSGAAYDT